MGMTDQIGLRGEVRAYLFGHDLALGSLEEILADRQRPEWAGFLAESVSPNLVTNLGRQQMTKVIVGETSAMASHIAVSTSVIAPALGDVVGTIPDRKATAAVSRTSISSYYQRYIAYFGTLAFGSTAINAAALLDAATTDAATNLWADASVTISKTTAQALVVEWRVNATTG